MRLMTIAMNCKKISQGYLYNNQLNIIFCNTFCKVNSARKLSITAVVILIQKLAMLNRDS